MLGNQRAATASAAVPNQSRREKRGTEPKSKRAARARAAAGAGPGWPGLRLHTYLVGLYCRGVDQVLGQEPHLHLVGADDVAHQQIVGAVIPGLVGLPGRSAGLGQDQLVRLEQAGDLDRNLLAAAWWSRDPGLLRDVRRHGHADPAEDLNPLGDEVDQLGLLAVVLVEEQVKLVEGVPGNLPVVFLVHVPQTDRVRQGLVQRIRAALTDVLIEADGEPRDGPELLDLLSSLADLGSGAGPGCRLRAAVSLYHARLAVGGRANVQDRPPAARHR